MTDSDTSIRLAKRVAEMIPCSRNEAEQYISGGWVSVDGAVIEEPGARVEDEQDVVVHDDAKLGEIVPVTILVHKPVDVANPISCITPETLQVAEHGNFRFLKRHLSNLTDTMPLDAKASGLVVLTQDFRIARKLVQEGPRVEQEYIVEVAGKIREDGLALLNHGLSFNGKELPPIKVSWQNETRLRFAIKGAKPGQILHMCRMVELKVVAIKRIRVGRVPMSSLPVGQWRYLHEYERF